MRASFRKKKHLGQHFLHDSSVIEQLVNFIAPQKSDHLVEIGPGEGALTSKLLSQVRSIDAIELDRELIPKLEKNCKNLGILRVHTADVLKTDFTKFTTPIRLVGNLPYNISTPILFKAIKNINLIKDMHFMLQKEVAERITSLPGSKTYGRLSIMIQYYCEVEFLSHVGADAFSPPPKVNSAFVRLIPRKHHLVLAQDEKLLSEIVRDAFNMRRKTILNGLKKYITAPELEEIGINPQSRPEQLRVDEFVIICNNILKNKL